MAGRRGRSRVLGLALAVVMGAALGACGGTASSASPSVTATPAASAPDPGVDAVSQALLETHGLRATGPTKVNIVTIGKLAEQPWSLYLEVSKAANLDFSALEGAGAELRITPVAGWADDGAAYVLVRSGTVVGAWIGPGGTSSGVLPITATP